MWPPPLRRGGRGGLLTWDVVALDRAADRLSGLAGAKPEALSSDWAEQAALERASRGTTSPNRNQHRHKEAA